MFPSLSLLFLCKLTRYKFMITTRQLQTSSDHEGGLWVSICVVLSPEFSLPFMSSTEDTHSEGGGYISRYWDVCLVVLGLLPHSWSTSLLVTYMSHKLVLTFLYERCIATSPFCQKPGHITLNAWPAWGLPGACLGRVCLMESVLICINNQTKIRFRCHPQV